MIKLDLTQSNQTFRFLPPSSVARSDLKILLCSKYEAAQDLFMAKCDTRCAPISKKRLGEQVSGAVDLHHLACLVSYIPPEGVDTDGAVRAIYPVPTPVYNKYCWPTQETPQENLDLS